jgi:hypothetical protein
VLRGVISDNIFLELNVVFCQKFLHTGRLFAGTNATVASGPDGDLAVSEIIFDDLFDLFIFFLLERVLE